MADFNKYKHLFDNGEYASVEKILSGLTLEQVIALPSAQSHTIYDELWHTATWQNIVINDDKELYQKWKEGEVYPKAQAGSQKDWDNLVSEFVSSVGRIMEITHSPEKMEKKLDYGITFGEGLQILATHNAYHLGKIVAMRQAMEAWNGK
jgi:hypothetical protein